MAPALCDQIGARLRHSEKLLNVRHKPRSAPETFLKPVDVKKVLATGPVEELFLCPCESCCWYSNCSAERRRDNYRPKELMGAYATIFALLLMENCAALIYEFQKREITLDQRLYQDHLNFLLPLLTPRWSETANTTVQIQVKELQTRILKRQHVLFARPLEVRDVQRELDAEEALPIDEDEQSKGKGGFGEVFAFRIFEEYKGEGFKALNVRLSGLSIIFAN